MSYYESLPGYQFTNEDLNNISQAYNEFNSMIPIDKITDSTILLQFLNNNIQYIGFEELFVQLAYSRRSTIFVDALNVAHNQDLDILGSYKFNYKSGTFPEIIKQTFSNYPKYLRDPNESSAFTLSDQIQFLKNLVVLFSDNNKRNQNYVLVFKIRNENVAKQGLYNTSIPYIYMLFVLVNSVQTEVDDLACVYFSYLLESKYGIPARIMSFDNYNWANLALRSFIDTHKVLFDIRYNPYTNQIVEPPYIETPGLGFTIKTFRLIPT